MLARSLSRHQGTSRALEQTWARSFASLPAPDVPADIGDVADSLQIVYRKDRGLLLLQMAERQWGSSRTSPRSLAESVPDTERVSVGVVRNPTQTAKQEQAPLSSMVAKLPGDRLGITPEGSRLVVDEYLRPAQGDLSLHRTSINLCRIAPAISKKIFLPSLDEATLHTYKALIESGSGQSAKQVVMVAPTAFTFNQQAAADNRFMHSGSEASSASDVGSRVLAEHNGLHEKLSNEYGVTVHLFEHSEEHGTPDAVFPNNWFSTHAQGEAAGGVQERALVFYPMKCPNRAKERRADIQGVLQRGRIKQQPIARVLDLSAAEQQHKYLEGTGAFVLDRVNGIAYLNVSERADVELAQQWVQDLGYKDLVTFKATGADGSPIYHTNVMMAIGSTHAIVCSESVADEGERQHLLARLQHTHKVIEITCDQMGAFCGNVLEVIGNNDLPLLAMSTGAHNAFTPEQRKLLLKHVRWLCHSPMDTIEYIGGGGVRCAIGELF